MSLSLAASWHPWGEACRLLALHSRLMANYGAVAVVVQVNGLDWESANRDRKRAVGAEVQQRAVGSYDLDSENWAQRVGVAAEIVQAGLGALARPLE